MKHIGNIIGNKGIKGEILFTSFFNNIFIPKGTKISIGYSKEFFNIYILTQDIYTIKNKSISLFLLEIQTKEEAIKLKEQGIFLEKDLILKYNPYFIFPNEIIGFNVLDVKTNENIGTIIEYWNMPANDVLLTKTKKGDLPIPLIDDIVKAIDIQNKIIKIVILDGLMDILSNKPTQ